MKVELLVTLKGKDRWKKGLILDSEKAPIPSDILAEIKQNKRTVKVLEGDPSPQPAPPDYERNEWDSKPPLSDSASDNVSLTVENSLPSKFESDNAETTPKKQETEKSAENTIECALCDHEPFPSLKALKIHKTKMHKENK